MSTPEGRVKTKVTKMLKALGDDCWYFMPVQSGFGRPALDYECCIRGRGVAIETKKPGGQMTPTQLQTRDAKIAAGSIVLLIWDDTSLAIAKRIVDGITYYDNRERRYALHFFLTEEARDLYEAHLVQTRSGKAA